VTMVFPGQELGLRGTIVPPGDSNPSAGPPFGYDRYDSPFFGKPIPAFKTYNSMMPLWMQDPKTGIPEHLFNLYSSIGNARRNSPALRGSIRVYLNQTNGSTNEQIFSIAKMTRRNASPKDGEVVLAFVNVTPRAPAEATFDVDIDADGDGVNDFGIEKGHMYNVKNIAAYTGVNAGRRDQFLWSTPISGSDLLQHGIFVRLNAVPTVETDWATAPYEPQYLKLFDVTQ